MSSSALILNPLADLKWCISSPSLLTSTSGTLLTSASDAILTPASYSAIQSEALGTHTWLEQSDLENELESHLQNRKSHFLGPYFEQLWLFYLKQHPRYDIVASNLQISHEGKTLGEFDVILYDKELQRHFHQELAIKFYLGWNSDTSIAASPLWIGPQTVDRLDLKMGRLCSHQLLLSQHDAARTVLDRLGITDITPQLVMKGRLFQPFHLSPVSTPDYVNPEHSKGMWLPLSKLKEYSDRFEKYYWKPLQKLEWIRTHSFDLETPVFSSEELIDYMGEQSRSQSSFRPVLFSLLEKTETSYEERNKLFVVSDNWPTLTKSTPTL